MEMNDIVAAEQRPDRSQNRIHNRIQLSIPHGRDGENPDFITIYA